MTPYYEDDSVTLYLGDCLDVIDELAVTPLVGVGAWSSTERT